MKLVGERRALAAAVMVFYFLFYGGIAFSGLVPELSRAFYAIAGVYGLAFFSLVAAYFWARWFAIGVALYGVIVGALGMWQVGAEPIGLPEWLGALPGGSARWLLAFNDAQPWPPARDARRCARLAGLSCSSGCSCSRSAGWEGGTSWTRSQRPPTATQGTAPG